MPRPTDVWQMRTLASRKTACGDACLFRSHCEVYLICGHCLEVRCRPTAQTIHDVDHAGVTPPPFHGWKDEAVVRGVRSAIAGPRGGLACSQSMRDAVVA